MKSERHRERGGYALLFIFVMAAIVAITLYKQVPSVAFEAQRDKEQLLIDRGEEYERAVTLYVRKFNRFPSAISDLENTNNQRFLRDKYKDPMTGKDDWRLIHAAAGGLLTDSVDSKKPDTNTDMVNTNSIITLTAAGAPTPGGDAAVNPGLRQRPEGGFDATGGISTAMPAGGGMPGGVAQPGAIGGFGATGMTGIMQPGQNVASAPPVPPVPPQITGPLGQAPSTAAGLINQILTTPRPGGMGGVQAAIGTQAQQSQQAVQNFVQSQQQQVIGAGIAGIASKREEEGIKIYKGHTSYNAWEFVYDVSKDPRAGRGGAVGATGGAGGRGATGPGGQIPVGGLPVMNPGFGAGGPGR